MTPLQAASITFRMRRLGNVWFTASQTYLGPCKVPTCLWHKLHKNDHLLADHPTSRHWLIWFIKSVGDTLISI